MFRISYVVATLILCNLLTSALEGQSEAGMEETRVLTFDPPALPSDSHSYNPYLLESNFKVGSDGGAYVQDAYNDGYPSNGTFYARALSGDNNFFIEHAYNSPFTILSIDISEYSEYFAYPKTVTFVGYKVDGSTVTQSFTTDGTMDGTGPAADFQTFSFNSGFTNLTKVVANEPAFMVDNIVVKVEGAEQTAPPPPALPLVYDVTWDGPPHTVDQIAAVNGPYAPSKILFGTPTVRAQVGTLVGPALEFSGEGYQQIEFSISKNAQAYRLEFDAYLSSELTVFFDRADGFTRFDLHGSFGVYRYTQNVVTESAFGTIPVQKKTHIEFSVSRLTSKWVVKVDGKVQYDGVLDLSDWDVQDIRFHADYPRATGIDNVRIYADGSYAENMPGPRLSIAYPPFFRSVTVGEVQIGFFTIYNTGAEPLVINNFGWSDPHFTCHDSFPITIQPGAYYSPYIQFFSTDVGVYPAQLIITNNDATRPTQTVPVEATTLGIPSLTADTLPAVAVLKGTRAQISGLLRNPGSANVSWYSYNSNWPQVPGLQIFTLPYAGEISPGQSAKIALQVDARLAKVGNYDLGVSASSYQLSNQHVDLPLSVRVMPPTRYNRWLFAKLGIGRTLMLADEEKLWSQEADPDLDGLSNLVEFLTGSDPAFANIRYAPTQGTRGEKSLYILRVRDRHDGAPFQIEWSLTQEDPNWQTKGITIQKSRLTTGYHLYFVSVKNIKGPLYFRIVPRLTENSDDPPKQQ